MDCYHRSKKIRLSAGRTKDEADAVDWGEEFDIPENFIQEIETQGYSQYQEIRPSTSTAFDNGRSPQVNAEDNNATDLRSELQGKFGEIKILRGQIEKCQSQITEKDNVIIDLKKQLKGKDSEIEVQRIALKAKTPNLNTSVVKFSPNRSFNHQKKATEIKNPRTYEVLNFPRGVKQGDLLHKLLKQVLNHHEGDVSILPDSGHIVESNENDGRRKFFLDENDFIVRLRSPLLQLCWFTSFEEIHAHKLIIFILKSCEELLTRVYQFLCQEPVSEAIKSKTITLNRLKDTVKLPELKDLLDHKKLFPTEKGIAARQAITAIAKLLEVNPKTGEMVIEPERFKASRRSCISYDRIKEHSCSIETHVVVNTDGIENLKIDEASSLREDKCWKKFFIFDIVALAHDIAQEVVKRNNSAEYEGILSSILNLYSVLCNSSLNLIYQKHEVLIMNTTQKILFSLPTFTVIRYIVKFLSTSSHYSFSGSLCCRSAVDTFSENFKYYNFSRETCMLQVLCVYIEMMEKVPPFVCDYTLWILSCISEPHEVQWVKNKNDSKLCECLLMLEQITIKVVLNCIEQYKDTKVSQASKELLKSALNRCVSIFQLLRFKDFDFDRNILPCRGEYRIMLSSLNEILVDQRTRNFVDQEFLRLNDEPKFDLPPEKREELVKSLIR